MFRSPPALAGFATGIIGTILIASAFGVVFNGQGLSDRNPEAGEIVYPNF